MTKKSNIINPTGLKGNEITERQIELMGRTVIKEGIGRSVLELTKVGPDDKVYGIVRENRKWYIKSADKGEKGLTVEDFQYAGGLQNKTSQAYPSYAKAIKNLNLKFISLHESLGTSAPINVFRNDHVLAESEGTVDADEFVTDKKGEALKDTASDKAEEGVTGDNLVGKTGKTKVEADWEKVKMSETEEKIDKMLTGEEEVVEESMLGAASFFQGDDIIVNDTLSISRGVDIMADAIDIATGERKIQEMASATELLKHMSKEEVISILENVTGKKKS